MPILLIKVQMGYQGKQLNNASVILKVDDSMVHVDGGDLQSVQDSSFRSDKVR